MRIILFILISVNIASCFAQETVLTETDRFENIYRYAEEKYGIDQFLVNGYYHEYKYKYAEGHPFLFENEYLLSDLVLHQTLYQNVNIKYDLFEQNLILKYRMNNTEVTSILPNEFLTNFTYGALRFEKLSFPNQEPAFFQVVAETENLSCLYYWFKTRQESNHNVTFVSYKFSNSRHKSFIEMDNELHRYKNKRSFIRLFPEQLQDKLSAYIKNGKIKMKEISDDEMSGMLQYCQSLINQMGLHKDPE